MTPEELAARWPVGSRWKNKWGSQGTVTGHSGCSLIMDWDGGPYGVPWSSDGLAEANWTRIDAPEPVAYSIERPGGLPGAEVLVKDLPTPAPGDGLRERADMRREIDRLRAIIVWNNRKAAGASDEVAMAAVAAMKEWAND